MRDSLAEVSFGEWLKRQRKAGGLTQEQLAQQIGCSTSALKKIEAEDRRASPQIVERLANILNIPQGERKAFLRFARGDWRAAPRETGTFPWLSQPPQSDNREAKSGIVTFLFTDIEDSVKLWESHPEQMKAALQRHHAILQESINANRGEIFQIVGDAFYAAFPTVTLALSAAVAAQHGLYREDWDLPFPLHVRMGIHSGEARTASKESQQGGYVSNQTLNRAARVLGAGHGGQILISFAARELVKDSLPKGTELRDMGEHYLKNLTQPEHLFQVTGTGLPSEFPPLNTLKVRRHNLPDPLTSFVGREREIEEINQSILKNRLVTLTGTGGTGKSRLSLKVALDVLDHFPQGVWLVELASLNDPRFLISAIGTVLGLRELQNNPLTQTLIDFLSTKQLLLVLDNCEHLIDACAQIVYQILKSCPHVKILATSREALDTDGETIYRVRSLTDEEARQLFIERSIKVDPQFLVTKDNIAYISQICSRLDGIPLAIELAAARIGMLPVEEITARLNDRFQFLKGSSRTALPRQQTLRSLIDWSYDLLGTNERTLFRRISVFASGSTLEATEQVCARDGIGVSDVLDLLSNLVSKSLVIVSEQSNQKTIRYRMLDTIRQYAREKLVESGEAVSIRTAHLDFFIRFTEEAGSKLRGPEQLDALNRLETEYDNIRAALEHSSHTGNLNAGLRIGWSLMMFWSGRGYWSEARQILTQILAQPTSMAEASLRVKGLIVLSLISTLLNETEAAKPTFDECIKIAGELGPEEKNLFAIALGLRGYSLMGSNLPMAKALCLQALDIGRQIDDKWVIANVLDYLGNIYAAQGNYSMAVHASRESRDCFLAMGNRWLSSRPLGNLGSISFQQGNYASAQSHWEAALAIYQEMGDKANTAFILGALAQVALIQEDFKLSAALYEESLAIRRAMGDGFSISLLLPDLGHIWLHEENKERASTLFIEGLTLHKKFANQAQISLCLAGLAALAVSKQKYRLAAQLLGLAEVLMPNYQGGVHQFIRVEIENVLENVRSILGEEEFIMAWEFGKQSRMDEAIPLILEQNL